MSRSNSPEPEGESIQNSTAKIFPWERLAFELRDKIFAEVDLQEPSRFTHGSDSYFRRGFAMPALVVALRQLPLSYGHVMEWFTKANSHLLYYDIDGCDLNDMTIPELNVIQSAELIFLGDYERHAFYDDDLWDADVRYVEEEMGKICYCTLYRTDKRIFTPPRALVWSLRLASNPCEVDLKFAGSDEHARMHFITEFPFCLQGCKSLSKVIVHIPTTKGLYINRSQRRKILGGVLNHLRKRVGIEGRKYEGPAASQSRGLSSTFPVGQPETWVWDAAPGQLMDWSQNLGRVWKNPPERPAYTSMDGAIVWKGSVLEGDYGNPRLELRDGRFTFGWNFKR